MSGPERERPENEKVQSALWEVYMFGPASRLPPTPLASTGKNICHSPVEVQEEGLRSQDRPILFGK
jgi:hypothetical protein